MNITATQARNEIARRALPKATRPKSTDPVTFRLSGAELLALAGTQAPAKAARKAVKAVKAAKPERTPAEKAATAARQLAWDNRKRLGMTYEQACAHYGTTPARKA